MNQTSWNKQTSAEIADPPEEERVEDTPIRDPHDHGFDSVTPNGFVPGTTIELYDAAHPDNPEYQLALKQFYTRPEFRNPPPGVHYCPPGPYARYDGFEERKAQLLEQYKIR